ncbi:MAG: FapA family protein [Spirochaetales bacterium]|nr:FapA family protein [Spirochaetales bacterium]
MSEEFRGSLKVEIDKDGLSAKIHFTPRDSADPYTLDSLKDLLAAEGVVHGIDQEKLEEAAREFAESMEPYLSDVVASGEPARPGSGETYNFSEFKYPSNLQKVADKILSMNKAPLIYDTIRVTVTRDKRVKDKGLFKSGKEKIVSVEEEEDKKIRVDVSPAVKEVGFFKKGDVVCTVVTGTGEPSDGKDIKGNVLKAPTAIEGTFYPGRNIKREKTEFIAEEDGFVRKGENWLDLIPFKNHSWSLRVSDNKMDCYIDIVAGHKSAPPPDMGDVMQAVRKLSLPEESLLDENHIRKLILSGCRSEGAQSFCLTRDRDGSFEIEINSLKTEANLHLYKGSGSGRALNLKQAWARVVELKIAGFEAERVKKEILDFNNSQEKEVTIFLARGEDPRRGDDREIVLETEYLPDEEVETIKGRLRGKQQSLSSFKDFPAEGIEKMALVTRGSKLFHIGQQKGGKDGKDIFGNVIKGIEGNDPILNVYENISIQEGVATSKIDGILDYSCKEMVYSLRVREHQDAKIVVSVSDNGMSATLSFLPPHGSGNPVSADRIREALEENGVVKGILEDEIERLSALGAEEKIVTDQLIAQGQIPFQGEQALKFLVDIEPGKKNTVPVEEGDLVAELGKKGEASSVGFNVLGEELYSEGDKGIEREKNILEENRDGQLVLKAGVKGLLCLENDRIYIKEKQTIRGDVSRTTGNIQFPGSVAISGSVLSGIFVNAGKDLTVMEVVEAALLSAGGNIMIGKGVKGDRKAVLRAGGSISLGFAEATNIMVSDILKVKKALMNSIVKCNGKLVSETEDTKIIGGNLKVKNGLSAGTLGSEREVKTHISFGQDYLVEDQINVVTREIEKINEQLPEIDSQLVLAEEKRNQKRLMALRRKKVQMLKILEKKGIKNFFLKEKFEIHHESEIRVNHEIYPGVIFESHGRSLEIKEKLTSVIVFFDSSSGKIKTKPLSS